MGRMAKKWDNELDWPVLELEAQELSKKIADELHLEQYPNGARKHLMRKIVRCSRLMVQNCDNVRQILMDKEAEESVK